MLPPRGPQPHYHWEPSGQEGGSYVPESRVPVGLVQVGSGRAGLGQEGNSGVTDSGLSQGLEIAAWRWGRRLSRRDRGESGQVQVLKGLHPWGSG